MSPDSTKCPVESHIIPGWNLWCGRCQNNNIQNSRKGVLPTCEELVSQHVCRKCHLGVLGLCSVRNAQAHAVAGEAHGAELTSNQPAVTVRCCRCCLPPTLGFCVRSHEGERLLSKSRSEVSALHRGTRLSRHPVVHLKGGRCVRP